MELHKRTINQTNIQSVAGGGVFDIRGAATQDHHSDYKLVVGLESCCHGFSIVLQEVTHYLVKWCSLPYEEATWELQEDLDPEKIKEFEEVQKVPLDCGHMVSRDDKQLGMKRTSGSIQLQWSRPVLHTATQLDVTLASLLCLQHNHNDSVCNNATVQCAVQQCAVEQCSVLLHPCLALHWSCLQERPPSQKWQKLSNSRQYQHGNQLREYQLEGMNWLLFNWFNR